MPATRSRQGDALGLYSHHVAISRTSSIVRSASSAPVTSPLIHCLTYSPAIGDAFAAIIMELRRRTAHAIYATEFMSCIATRCLAGGVGALSDLRLKPSRKKFQASRPMPPCELHITGRNRALPCRHRLHEGSFWSLFSFSAASVTTFMPFAAVLRYPRRYY